MPIDNPIDKRSNISVYGGQAEGKSAFKQEVDRISRINNEMLIHNSFPRMDVVSPAHEGSKSSIPNKGEGDYEESAPYITKKEVWRDE